MAAGQFGTSIPAIREESRTYIGILTSFIIKLGAYRGLLACGLGRL